jgi:signal transduction histidine kinase
MDANEVVGHTTAMVAEALSSHKVRLEIELCSFPLWVCGDQVRLQQVILNLVNNAREAMPQGGLLTIRTTTSLNTDQQSCAVIEVEDTGTGIDPQDLPHLFEPFFSRKPKGQGTGLGLAICQSIAKEMGGEMSVHSRVGKGTIFSVILPILSSSKRCDSYARA